MNPLHYLLASGEAGLNWDTCASVSAAVIALAALVLSIREGRQSRNHDRLSVRPYLDSDINISPAYDRIQVTLSNQGIGPAILSEWSLLVDGKTCEELGITRWEQLTTRLNLKDLVNYEYITDGTIMAPGKTMELFGVPTGQYSTERATLYRDAIRRLTIKIKYQSIYQEEAFTYLFEGDKILPAETPAPPAKS